MQQSYTNYSSVTRIKYWLLLNALCWWWLFRLPLWKALSSEHIRNAVIKSHAVSCLVRKRHTGYNLHRMDNFCNCQVLKNTHTLNGNNYFLIFIKQSQSLHFYSIFFPFRFTLQISPISIYSHLQITDKPASLSRFAMVWDFHSTIIVSENIMFSQYMVLKIWGLFLEGVERAMKCNKDPQVGLNQEHCGQGSD